MADDDNTQPEENKGGILLPATAGVVGGYGGALGASHLIGRKSTLPEKKTTAEKEVSEKQTAYDSKLSEELKKADSKAKVPHEEFKGAEKAHLDAKGAHADKLNELWNDKIKAAATPKEVSDLRIANLEGQVKHLESIESPHAKEAVEAVKAQIDAVKKVPVTGTVADAHAAIETALTDSYAAKKVSKEAHDLVLAAHRTQPVFDAMKKVDSKAAEDIAKHADVVSLTKTVEEKATELGKKKTAWETIEKEILGQEAADLSKSKKALDAVKVYEKINVKTGVASALLRPFKMIQKAPMSAKLGVSAAAVGLGALSYLGIQAMRGSNTPSNDTPVSYTDRIDQERQQTQSVGSASPSPA